MAHFAEIDSNNTVLRVIVVHNNELMENGQESEAKGIEFCNSLFPDSVWVQTSYNAKFRKNYAGIGYTWDSTRDAFIPPKPFASWLLNETTCRWEAPSHYPQDERQYYWDEPTMTWVEVAE